MIQALVSGGRHRDGALRALYAKGAEFRRFFVFKGLSPQEAEDLLQDCIIKIFRNAAQYKGSGGFGDGSANAWMWNIARNGLTDHYRTRRAGMVSIDNEAMSATEKHALEAEMSTHNPHTAHPASAEECVARGIEVFAAEQPDRARALEMQMDGQDINSIASHIGRTLAATKEYLSQCKKKLAPYIQHCRALLAP